MDFEPLSWLPQPRQNIFERLDAGLEKRLDKLPVVLAAYLLVLQVGLWLVLRLGLALPRLADDAWLWWQRAQVWGGLVLLWMGGL
jgi:hypothetical protein